MRSSSENTVTSALQELVEFLALTFALTFGLGVLVIFFRPQFERIVGPLGPLLTSWPYYVGACAPTISAIVLTARLGGVEGLKKLIAGLIRPFRLRWLFVALLAFPTTLVIFGFAERALSPGEKPMIDIHAILMGAPLTLLTTANIAVDPGPWGEETGWRGFALPRLLRLLSPLNCAILLGVIWAIWHAPAFLVSDLTQSNYNFGWYLIATTGASVLMTWIYVNANGNFFVAGFLPHATNNLMFVTRAFVEVEVQAAVLTALAAAIVIGSGPSLKGWRFLLSRKGAQR